MFILQFVFQKNKVLCYHKNMKMKKFDSYAFCQRLIQFLGILALLGTFVLVIWFYHLGILNDSNALKDFVNQHRFCGPLVFILVQIFQVVFPVIPGGVTTVAGFLIFNPILAFIYNYLGIVIGSIILFLLVRQYGRRFILLFIDEKTFYKYEAKLDTQNYENFFILCMLSPISPADIVVMITGLSRISLKRFILIILLTKPISIISYSYIWIFGGNVLKLILNH